MDLEEVWKIRLDRFRFFWEEIYNRFWIRRLWWVQAEGQVVSTVLYLKTGYGKVLLQWLIP